MGLLVLCFEGCIKKQRVLFFGKHGNDTHTSADVTVCISQYQLLKFLKPDHKVTTYKVGAEPLSVRMSLGCCWIVIGELEPDPELADDTLGGRISGRQSAAEPTWSGSW